MLKRHDETPFIEKESWTCMDKRVILTKISVIMKGTLLLLVLLFLVGCDSLGGSYNDFIQNSASEIEQSSQLTPIESENQASESSIEAGLDEFIDARLVPEQSMVENALLSLEDLSFGDLIFSTNQRFIQKQQAFEVAVDSFQMYEVTNYETKFESEFNFDQSGASILLMHATITNTSNDTFYFPIEELRLTYPSATIHNYPSKNLYPMESGNLADILLANSGEMAPQTAVEGYLVYGIGGEATQEILEAGNFYLTVVPPRENLSQIVGLGSNPLGEELPLFLPINEETSEQLLLNMTYIQDRLTTELWGTKQIISTEQLNQTEVDQEGVEVTMNRIEVSEFVPNEQYEEAFQYFTYGQMIVSIEYVVTNHSDVDVLPIDGSASLVINGDEIKDDYILINELYGKSLKPGQNYSVVKTFALDKMSYANNWQGNDYYFSLTIPFANQSNENEVNIVETIDGSEDELMEETLDLDKSEVFFEFTWSPELAYYVNQDLELLTQKEWLEKQVSEEEATDEIEAD